MWNAGRRLGADSAGRDVEKTAAVERRGIEPAWLPLKDDVHGVIRIHGNSDLPREVVRRARALGVHPGYALGRDYEGMDDVLLVAVTEKRTIEDIDRLASVLEEVCR